MKKEIEINGRNYYYESKISSGEFSDFVYTSFFKKGEPIKKRIVKKKYLFFGPIIKDEIIVEDTFFHCFDIGVDLSVGSIIDPDYIKSAEEKFARKIRIQNDKIVL